MWNTKPEQTTEEVLDQALERITTDLRVLNKRKEFIVQDIKESVQELKDIDAILVERSAKFQEMVNFIQKQNLTVTKEIDENENFCKDFLKILGE